MDPWQIIRTADADAFRAASEKDQEACIALAGVQIGEAADLISCHKQMVATGKESPGLFAKQAHGAAKAAMFGAAIAKAGDPRGNALVGKYEAMRGMSAGVPGADTLKAIGVTMTPAPSTPAAATTAYKSVPHVAAHQPELDPIQQAMTAVLSERMVKALVGINVGRQMQGKPALAELPDSTVRMLAREVHGEFLRDDAYRREQAAVASARAFNVARKASAIR